MHLRLWGVRGSVPTPDPAKLGYGGNTTCVEVLAAVDGPRLILDCGTGLRNLGLELHGPGAESAHDILLTHFHWDHIQGFPYFSPLYNDENRISIYAAANPNAVRDYFATQMKSPFFPVLLPEIPAKLEFCEVTPGVEFELNGFQIFPLRLNHPQGATGYRIRFEGQSVVCVWDHECGDPSFDEAIIEACRDADVLVIDGQYTQEEYPSKVGWGHSSYEQVTALAQTANVRRVVIVHHDPEHDDLCLSAIASELNSTDFSVTIGQEGTTIQVQ